MAELRLAEPSNEADAVWFVPSDPVAAMHTHLALARFTAGDTKGAEAQLRLTAEATATLPFPQGAWSQAYASWLTGWMLVEIDHQHARQKMVEAGVKAAIELFSRPGDRYVYSIWRRSEYIVDFPVAEILRELNVAEGYAPNDVRGWGGSENVGGSPRGVGSRLSPDQVQVVVDQVVERTRAARFPEVADDGAGQASEG